MLIDAIASKKSLKSIDLSKNKFQPESLEHIFIALERI